MAQTVRLTIRMGNHQHSFGTPPANIKHPNTPVPHPDCEARPLSIALRVGTSDSSLLTLRLIEGQKTPTNEWEP
jgi:hypothetical protein